MRNIIALFPYLFLVAQLSSKPYAWPVYAFQNGVHFKTTKERVKVLKELGYDGIGSAKLAQSELPLPQRLKLYDEAGLKLFSFYVGGRLGPKGHSYAKEISQAIKDLKGRDTILELFVLGSKKANTDEQAVAFVREIADQAKESGLRIVLYPHAGFYVDTLGDAVRVARKCKRNNVGVMFNLCHYLKVEPKTDLKAALTEAKPLLWQVSTSGAKKGGNGWGEIIQTLDRGDYDQKVLFGILRHLGFQGNVGFQCYAIRGDSRENLKRSIEAWKQLYSK
ncbi:MAG: TIM barrel protein [Opitutae bacterium]|jgi:sugar phosphate isomerase/epimerase|nr:TIM barrel protein [Opitutae bacterium]